MAGLTKVASDFIEFRAGVDAEFDSVTVSGEPSSEDQVVSCGYADTRYLHNIDGGYQDLTYNGDFIKYANKTGTSNWYDYRHPDGWIYSDDGSDGKIGYDASEGCCKIVTSSDGTSMSMKQGLHEFLRWQKTLRGKQVSATLRIKASSNVVCRLYDGVTTASGECSGPDEYEDISLTLAVDATATGLWVDCITSGTTETIELFEVYCNIGPVSLQGLPKKVDYIGLWQGQENDYPDNILEGDATEIPAGYTRLESFLNGRFGTGAGGRSKLPEYRGRFLRTWANGSANDPDRATRFMKFIVGTTAGSPVLTGIYSPHLSPGQAIIVSATTPVTTTILSIDTDAKTVTLNANIATTQTGVSAAVTVGDVSGSKQADQMQGHRHNFLISNGGSGSSLGAQITTKSNNDYIYSNVGARVTDPITDGTNGTPRTGPQTHGININTLAGIRWC